MNIPYNVSRVSRKDCVQIVEICTFMNGVNFRDVSPLFSAAVRTESRSNMCLFDKRQFDSNVLLFTPSLTVYVDSRPRVNETASIMVTSLFTNMAMFRTGIIDPNYNQSQPTSHDWRYAGQRRSY